MQRRRKTNKKNWASASQSACTRPWSTWLQGPSYYGSKVALEEENPGEKARQRYPLHMAGPGQGYIAPAAPEGTLASSIQPAPPARCAAPRWAPPAHVLSRAGHWTGKKAQPAKTNPQTAQPALESLTRHTPTTQGAADGPAPTPRPCRQSHTNAQLAAHNPMELLRARSPPGFAPEPKSSLNPKLLNPCTRVRR